MKRLWGTRVLVNALSMRVLGWTDGTRSLFKVPQAADVPWFDQTAQDAWPGDPIALDWNVPKGPRFSLEPSPNGSAIVRYRRFTLEAPQLGLIIGESHRWEGDLRSDGADGLQMAGAKRSIGLYQVSLQPPPRTAKALVVLTHPQDLTVIGEERPEAPPPSRVGVGGRLGGGGRA